MGRMLQEALSSRLGILEEEFKLESRLSQVRSRGKYPRVANSVFWVLEYCTGFGIEPIHRARLTKLGRGWSPLVTGFHSAFIV